MASSLLDDEQKKFLSARKSAKARVVAKKGNFLFVSEKPSSNTTTDDLKSLTSSKNYSFDAHH